eukprot:2485339-Pleurochrysis_carterae.AAC.1
MYVGRTRRRVHAVGRKQISEFAGQEFASIITVESANDVRGGRAAGVHRFKAGVIIDDHKCVLASAVDRFDEGSGD